MELFNKFMHDETGATSIEYGLLIATLAMGVCKSIDCIGSHVLNPIFENIASNLNK